MVFANIEYLFLLLLLIPYIVSVSYTHLYTKVIKMVKSPKTGAYTFDEQMVLNEKVQDFFKK